MQSTFAVTADQTVVIWQEEGKLPLRHTVKVINAQS